MSHYAELLDTSVVAPRDRPEYWSAGIAKRFFPMRVDAVSAPTFDARLVGGRIGPVAVGSIQGRPHRVVRTSAQISAGDPECILLYLLVRGAVRIEQEDRSCVLRPGDLACHDTSRPSVFEGQRGLRSAPLQRAALVHRGALREHRETQRNPGSWCRCAPRPVGSSLPGELGPRGNRRRRAAGQRR